MLQICFRCLSLAWDDGSDNNFSLSGHGHQAQVLQLLASHTAGRGNGFAVMRCSSAE